MCYNCELYQSYVNINDYIIYYIVHLKDISTINSIMIYF